MANNFDRAVMFGENVPANTAFHIYSCPTTATTKTIGIGLVFSNISTSQIEVTMQIIGCNLLKSIPIPASSSIEYNGGNKIVMKSGDVMTLSSNTAGSLDAYFSYMEIT